jgi:hypothetical protein
MRLNSPPEGSLFVVGQRRGRRRNEGGRRAAAIAAPLPPLRRMKAAGWPIRFRLNPMVPYPGWQQGYEETIREINAIEPEMITLGALRAIATTLRSAARKNGRDESIFDFLIVERHASTFRYRIPFEQQVEPFCFALDRLDPRVKRALCKEDESVWRALGLPFDGCHCLLDGEDALTEKQLLVERFKPQNLIQIQAAVQRSGGKMPIMTVRELKAAIQGRLRFKWTPYQLNAHEQAEFASAKKRGYLIAPERAIALQNVWFSWCEIQEAPCVKVLTRRRFAEVGLDLYGLP